MTDALAIIECTAARPWSKQKELHQRVRHAGAEEVGDQRDGWPGGDIQPMRCRDCGTRWEMELPQ